VAGYFNMTTAGTFTFNSAILDFETADGQLQVSSQTASISGSTISLTAFNGIRAYLSDSTLADVSQQSITLTATTSLSMSADLANFYTTAMQAISASAQTISIQAAGLTSSGPGSLPYGILIQSNAVGGDNIFQSTGLASLAATNAATFVATSTDDNKGTITILSAGLMSITTTATTNSLLNWQANGQVNVLAPTMTFTTTGLNGFSTGSIEVQGTVDAPIFTLPAVSLSNTYGQMLFKTANSGGIEGSLTVESVAGQVSMVSNNGVLRMWNTGNGIKFGSTSTMTLESTSNNAFTVDSMAFTAVGSIGFRAAAGNINVDNSDVMFEMITDNTMLINSGGTFNVETLGLISLQSTTYGLYLNSTRGAVRLVSPLISFQANNFLIEGQNININSQNVYIAGENQGAYFAGSLATLSVPNSQEAASGNGVNFQSILIYAGIPSVTADQICTRERAIGYTQPSSGSANKFFCICQDKYWRCLF